MIYASWRSRPLLSGCRCQNAVVARAHSMLPTQPEQAGAALLFFGLSATLWPGVGFYVQKRAHRGEPEKGPSRLRLS